MPRRKRKVRAHLKDSAPSIEGVLVGRSRGFYVLWAPKVLKSEDESVTLTGHVEIPRDQVHFFQVLDG